MNVRPEVVDFVFHLANVWMGINSRCNHSGSRSFKDYGARGISLSPEWSGRQGQITFVKWAITSGWKEGLVIDRKNGHLGYSPDNCRWVTHKENARNRIKGNNFITYEGETKCAAAWGDDPRCVVPSKQFQQRIHCGWEIKRALTTPLRSWGPGRLRT